MLFGALLLWSDHQEVEDAEHQQEQTDLFGSATSAAQGP
jgi:hypothetical protein